jgi:dipeptidyl-peptidase-4
MRSKICFLIAILMINLSALSSPAENAPEKLTVEWLFDRNIQQKLRSPHYTWLDNGKALILDSKIGQKNRTLEFIDPQTGERSEAINRDKVLEALRKKSGKKAPQFISWPNAVDPHGKAIIYVIAGDLFLVELAHSSVNRLTWTSSQEKSSSFSPDGLWVSFIRDNDLYVLDWKSGTERRLTKDGSETLLNGTLSWVYWEEIYDHTPIPYRWSPDSRAIAYLQTDVSSVSISTFVNFEPATQEVIRQRYPKSGQVNPKVRLGIVELSTAETTWIDCGNFEYLARFNWLRNSKQIAVQTLNRGQSELKLFFADIQTGKSQIILIENQPAWINLNNSLYFLKDGSFVWLSERDGFQHLYLYGTDGQLIEQLTKGDFTVLSSAGSFVARNGGLVGVDEKDRWIYFISNKQALKERHLYRIKLDGTGLERLTHQRGVHFIDFSPCMGYYFDTYSNSQFPTELSLYKTEGTKIATVAPSAKNLLKKFNLSSPEFHNFSAEDGLDLPAMMTRPVNFDPKKKYAAIIYVYGGPGSQQVTDSWRDRWLWHSLLAQEGFFVFVFEVRAGLGKNKALEASVYRRAYGMQNVKDILSGVRWLEKFPFIDKSRLGIWGWSGGGCTTLFTMTHSDVFKAAIAVAPVSDWRYYDTIYTERYQSTPQDNPEGYQETSSVLAAKNLKGRLLIVHGTYDDNVHPQNTYAFINSLIKNNIPFELMIYPWRKHGIRDTPARIHLYNLMLDFWKRNLK